MSELKLYPSGFLGSNAVPQTEPVDVVTSAKQLFNKGLQTKVSRYLANQEVANLWDGVNAGTPEFRTFEFKERILRAALSAFGTERVLDWIGSQSQSPYFSDYHRRWIDETILFVYGGMPRQLSENAWRTFLSTDNDAHPGEQFSRTVRHYLMGEKLRSFQGVYSEPWRGNLTFVDFIADWCAKERGIVDLLASLNNLFGKR